MATPDSKVKELKPDESLETEIANAGSKLVVIDFYAQWCGPCKTIAPIFVQLSVKYPNVVFIKVDVDKCQTAATSRGISAMPTFQFYRAGKKVQEMQGADADALESNIKKWMGSEDEEEVLVKGHMDLNNLIYTSGCECLNDSDEHPMKDCFTSKEGTYLESDCDEELICHIAFQQPVKLHSLRIKAPSDQGPKTLKFFINQTVTLDFDSAKSMKATQDIEVKPEELDGTVIGLAYVKFQNVQNLTLFICDNQEGEETTRMDYLGFIGSPVTATNMSDFKRVAGKKGESH